MKIRGLRCGLGNHQIKGAAVFITDPRHLAFVRKRLKEFRESYGVCKKCYNAIKIAYDIKYEKAKQKRKLSFSVSSATDNTNDSIDRLVQKTPRDPRLKEISKNILSQDNTEGSISLPMTSTSSSMSSLLDDRPTTSAAARALKNGKRLLNVESDTDDEYMPSPNALNGTRRPDIQPIPKRRQFQHQNEDIMNIYLAGTTGG